MDVLLSSLAPGGKMRDPGNEVEKEHCNLSLTKEKERSTINTMTTTCNWSEQRKSNGTV